MKKLILFFFLFSTFLAHAQFLTVVPTFIKMNPPVNSMDSIGYTYPGKIGGYSFFYNIQAIRAKFASAPDQVISGLNTTVSGTSATTTAGSWSIGGVIYSTSSSTVNTIPAQDASKSQYVIVYVNTSNQVLTVNGVLANAPQIPDIPDNTIPIAQIFIQPGSVTTIKPVVKSINTTGNQTKSGILTLASKLKLKANFQFLTKPVDTTGGYRLVMNNSGNIKIDTVTYKQYRDTTGDHGYVSQYYLAHHSINTTGGATFGGNVNINNGGLNIAAVSYGINIYNPGIPAQNTQIVYSGILMNSSSGQNSQLSSGGLIVSNSGYANYSSTTDNGVTAADVNGYTGYNRNGMGYNYGGFNTSIGFAIPTANVSQTIPALNGTYMLYVNPPASSTDTGLVGQYSQDSSYYYWVSSTNHWCRVAKDLTY